MASATKNTKKVSKSKAINRYISLSDWKGISLQFNKKKVWFSFQKPGSNSNKSLCRDKSIIKQINILIENMGYAPDKLDLDKIKQSMTERQWSYLKPGVIVNFVKNYNTEIKQHLMMPSSAPMDEQQPSTNPSFTNDSMDDDNGNNYTKAPSECDYTDYIIKNEQSSYDESCTSHEQETSYPMEQQYGLPSEVATFDNENHIHHQYVDNSGYDHYNLSPAPIQNPSNVATDAVFMGHREEDENDNDDDNDDDDDNDIDLLPTTLPTEPQPHYPTDPQLTFVSVYPDPATVYGSGPYSYSYPAIKGSEYDNFAMPPSTSDYYEPLKMTMYPSSTYSSGTPTTYEYMYPYVTDTPPSPNNIYVSKEDEKEFKEWVKEKTFDYENYKIQMMEMRKHFENRIKKAMENEGHWKKKYEDLLTKYTMETSTNDNNHNIHNIDDKSPTSSQFSTADVAIGDLNIDGGSGSGSGSSSSSTSPSPSTSSSSHSSSNTKLRKNKRSLNEFEFANNTHIAPDDNINYEFMNMIQESPPKRFKIDQDYVGNSSSSCSSDMHLSADIIMNNNDLRHFDEWTTTNDQFSFNTI